MLNFSKLSTTLILMCGGVLHACDHLPLDEQTVEALIALARRETIPAMRSAALHVLACEGCKSEACPTSHGIVGFLIDVLRNDMRADVRRQTIDGLRSAATEPRVHAVLREALHDAAFKIRWKAGLHYPAVRGT